MTSPTRRHRRPARIAQVLGAWALVILLAASLVAPVLARGSLASLVYSGPARERTIALTFDDGWNTARCLEIYHILVDLEVPATFFPNAIYVRTSPKAWETIAARFPIANHTYHHLSLPSLSTRKVRQEIADNEKVIEKVTGQPMLKMLRPPFGAIDERTRRIAADLGYDTVVMWDTTDADTSHSATPRSSTRAALRGGPGSIILMHCGPDVTPVILPIVIAHYACDGYRFATVEGLLAGEHGQAAKVTCPAPPIPKASRPSRGGNGPSEPSDTTPTGGDPLATLVGREWLLRKSPTPGEPLRQPRDDRVVVRFDGGVASGVGLCGRFAAPFTVSEPSGLAFGPIWRSTSACEGTDAVALLLSALPRIDGYKVRGATLVLSGPDGFEVRLGIDKPKDLVGRWSVTAVADDAGILGDLPATGALGLAFDASGALRTAGSCRGALGTYTTSGSAMGVGLLVAEAAGCGASPEDRQLLRALQRAATWQVRSGVLIVQDAEGHAMVEASWVQPAAA